MPKNTAKSLFEDDDFFERESLIAQSKPADTINSEQEPIRVSPSLLEMLLQCPHCLWLYFNKGIKRPDGIFPSLPGGVDGVLKQYFDSYRAKGELPPEIVGKVEGKLYPNLSNLNPWRSNYVGIKTYFKQYNILLKGAIDELLINDNNEVIIFDFKTRGYALKEDTHKYYQLQMDLYGLLFSTNDFKVADKGYLFFVYPKDFSKSALNMHSQIVPITIDPLRGQAALEQVISIINKAIPKPSESCTYCQYRTKKVEL